MTRVYLGLGANLGERERNLRLALAALEAGGCAIDRVSSLYDTEPVGPVRDQPRFLNCAVRGSFGGSAWDLLDLIGSVEAGLGRRRLVPLGPRTIDVDLLYFGDARIEDPPRLVVPHPGIPDRRFVLLPLAEIDPDLVHPTLGKTQAELLEETRDASEVLLVQAEP